MTFEPITTERLLLRPFRSSDTAALHQRRNHPDVAAFQSWTLPYPLDRAERMVSGLVAMDGPVTDEWWSLTVADRADTQIFGDLVMLPTLDGRAVEVGYTLDPSVWGQGYAVEAVAALVERILDDQRVTRLSAMLHPENIASAQVLERTGFVFEGYTKLSYWVGDDNSDDLIYGMTRAQYHEWVDRARTAPIEVRLVEITVDNTRSVEHCVVHHSQLRLVSSVVDSYADAMFPEVVDGAPLVPWMRAVEADGELVGFVMLSQVTEAHPEPGLWKLLVDRRHQRRGIGRRVIDLVVDECRSMGATSLTVSWCRDRGSPEPLYIDYGFVPTGDIVDGEIDARLTFGRDSVTSRINGG